MFLAEVDQSLVGSGAWTFWCIVGGYELYWFSRYLLFVTVAILYWLQTREGSKKIIGITPVLFFELDGWLKATFSVWQILCFVENDVCYFVLPSWRVSIAVVGGKRFLSGRPRDFWHCIFHRSFCFLGANYRNRFYDCKTFRSWGQVFAHGGEFFLPS